MVKTLLQVLFTVCLAITLSSHAEISNNLNALKSKFDQNIAELTDEKATYVVYFGDGLNSTQLKTHSFSSQQNKANVALKAQQQVTARRANILNSLPANDYQLVRSYKAVPAMVIRASAATIKQLAKSPLVKKIGLDNSGGGGHLEQALPQTNINLVKALPLSGAGIEVAIIDSGLDQDHPDFANRVASQVCFSSDCETSIYDQNGHGTNVAGIIAGAGGIAPQGGAPAVTLHILKILDASNTFDSANQIVSALDHIITELPNVSIVNMSVGTSELFPSVCDDTYSWTRSLASAVNQLNARGVTLFASSGNEGDNTAITAPACLTHVIAVGAIWDTGITSYNGFCDEPSPIAGELACFSNSNDTVDIVAPGALITATGRDHGVSNYAGTSMASPLVASCAALLRQKNPRLTPTELRTLLIAHAGNTVTDSAGRNFPSLDCWQAYQALPNDKPPLLTRISPQSPLTTTEQTLQFSVTAQDTEDGDISSQVNWWINDVNINKTGGDIEHTFLLGDYTVTAKVVDSANNEVKFDWLVSIVSSPIPPPEIVISSPDHDSQYHTNQTVNFIATATDQNDGDISVNIQWLFNDEVIAEGASFSQTFEIGAHVVIAQIQNAIKNTSQAQVSFTVSAPPPPIVPTPPSGSSSGGAILYLHILALLLITVLRRQFFARKS
ncbi:MAG: hypothetical protein ACI9LM_003655 [Alteromonadaceae bacterium]|jgi:hypothetical protein